MPIQKGFLLSYVKYGDNDAVLHCFTHEKGFQSFFVRGIYSPKNRKKSFLLPLCELAFFENTNHKTGTIQNISKMELVRNPDFYSDVKANSIIFFIADFLNQILRNENQSPKIYAEILNFISELEARNYQSHFIFLFKFLKIQGFLPLFSESIFLNPETGNFSESKTNLLFDEEVSKIWKQVITSENAYEIKISSSIKKKILDSLLVYYQFHFPEFRTPNSLEIVQQIFE